MSRLRLLPVVIGLLLLSACRAEPATSATCPPPPDVTFPVAISLTTSLPMPLGQFLGRTRAQNETLLTPQSQHPLTGWVTYAPGFSLRYQGGRAVALKATLYTGMPWREMTAHAGLQPAVAPTCEGAVCRWELGELCYDTLPLAATWDSATGVLHVWQARRGINGWLLAGGVLMILALGGLWWRRRGL